MIFFANDYRSCSLACRSTLSLYSLICAHAFVKDLGMWMTVSLTYPHPLCRRCRFSFFPPTFLLAQHPCRCDMKMNRFDASQGTQGRNSVSQKYWKNCFHSLFLHAIREITDVMINNPPSGDGFRLTSVIGQYR